jgi:hypothetical protein
MRLRDAGKKEEAKALLLQNGIWCRQNGELLKNPALLRYAEFNREDALNLDALDWGVARKQMRDAQYQNSVGQGLELEKATRRRLPAPAGAQSANPQ